MLLVINRTWQTSNPQFEVDADCPLYKSWPWNGHRIFSYDLIGLIAPTMIVELGTYWGTSLFSFCQAVKDKRLATKIFAVDTWEGDIHAGSYDDSVYHTVRQRAEKYYSMLDLQLLKMRFDEALGKFQDNTIDLIHIDGCHEYEAVRDDFESWLPKLSPHGIMLFHDVGDYTGYGSAKFWKEISERHPSFHFNHSWGLGVLFPKGNNWLQCLEANNLRDKIEIYTYLSDLNLTKKMLEDLQQISDARGQYIEDLEKRIATQENRHDQQSLKFPLSFLKRVGLFFYRKH